jgi:hypothetical protein
MLDFFEPATQAAAHPTLSTVLDFIDKIVKVVAVLIAGAWGYLNYRRGRTFKRRLEPRISGKIFVRNNSYLLCGQAQLKNVGLSVVTIEQKGTAIVVDDELLVEEAGQPPRVETQRVKVLEVFAAHGWIEPGEPIEQSFLIALPEAKNRVAARLRLRIVSHSVEWNDDSIAEIVEPAADNSSKAASIEWLSSKFLVQKFEDPPNTAQTEQQNSAGPIST